MTRTSTYQRTMNLNSDRSSELDPRKMADRLSGLVISAFVVLALACAIAPRPAQAVEDIDFDTVSARQGPVTALDNAAKKFRVLDEYCSYPHSPNKTTHLNQLNELLTIAQGHFQFTSGLMNQIRNFRNTPLAERYSAEISRTVALHNQTQRMVRLIRSKITAVNNAPWKNCGGTSTPVQGASVTAGQPEQQVDPLQGIDIRKPEYQEVSMPSSAAGPLCSWDEYYDLLAVIGAERSKAADNSRKASYVIVDISFAQARYTLDESDAGKATMAALNALEGPARAELRKWDDLYAQLDAMYQAAKALQVIDCDKQNGTNLQEPTQQSAHRDFGEDVQIPEVELSEVNPPQIPEFVCSELDKQQLEGKAQVAVSNALSNRSKWSIRRDAIRDALRKGKGNRATLISARDEARAEMSKWDHQHELMNDVLKQAQAVPIKDCEEKDDKIGLNSGGQTEDRVAQSPQVVDGTMLNRLAIVTGSNPYVDPDTGFPPVYGYPPVDTGLDVLYDAQYAANQRQRDVLRNQALEDCDDPQTANNQYPQTHKSATTTLAETVNTQPSETGTTDQPTEKETATSQPVETATDTTPAVNHTPKTVTVKTETTQTGQPAATQTETVVHTTPVNTTPVMTETVKTNTPVLPAQPTETVVVNTPQVETVKTETVNTPMNQPVVNNAATLNTRTVGTDVVVKPKEQVPVNTNTIPVNKTIPTTRDAGLNTRVNTPTETMTESGGNKFNPVNLGVNSRTQVEVVDTETAKTVNPNTLSTRNVGLNVETPNVETANEVQPAPVLNTTKLNTPALGKTDTTNVRVLNQSEGIAPVTSDLNKGGLTLQTNELSPRSPTLSTPDTPKRNLEVRIGN